MISAEQVEEWIRELEERPNSGSILVRSIGNRLRELDAWNQDLLTDNIALRSEYRVEEYEQRIASLEYQLELLKRQLSGLAINSIETISGQSDQPQIILFQSNGALLKASLPADLTPGILPFSLPTPLPIGDEQPGFFIASPREEILFVFDSGRSQTMPMSKIAETLDWDKAILMQPRAGENLTSALPIATLPMVDNCVQVSRRGFAKKMMRPALETFISHNMVGAGVKSKPDRAAFLILSAKDNLLVLVTWEGYVVTLPNIGLPYAVEQIMQVGPTDHLVAAFSPGTKKEILFVTTNGKVIHRDISWLEPAGSFRARGQAIIPTPRRESGTRLAGATAVTLDDWLIALHASGSFSAHPVESLLSTGSLQVDSDIVAFSTVQLHPRKE
jgi:hypothetical protein